MVTFNNCNIINFNLGKTSSSGSCNWCINLVCPWKYLCLVSSSDLIPHETTWFCTFVHLYNTFYALCDFYS